MTDIKSKPTRDGYGDALVEMGALDERVVVLGADLSDSTRALWFWQKYPERFFEFGIAEQNMLNAAAGLSLAGKIPWVSTYGVFVAGRAWDQIRTTICYSNLNVKIAGAHGGISVGPDGATHQALEDVATMRVLPNRLPEAIRSTPSRWSMLNWLWTQPPTSTSPPGSIAPDGSVMSISETRLAAPNAPQ